MQLNSYIICFVLSMLYLLFFFKGLDLCNTFVCLTWTVNTGHLDLQCRVNYLIYGIEIFNNRRKELGFCLHPQPVPKCFSYSNDTTIMQNSKTNITYLKIKGHIDSNLNGQWECRHGTNRDNATINVTVLNSGTFISFYVKKLNSNGSLQACFFRPNTTFS